MEKEAQRVVSSVEVTTQTVNTEIRQICRPCTGCLAAGLVVGDNNVSVGSDLGYGEYAAEAGVYAKNNGNLIIIELKGAYWVLKWVKVD